MNNNKTYNLEDRTFSFAKNCRFLIKKLKRNVINDEDTKQLVRSSGSVGANYIEANEKLSDKDFKYRIRISLKEAKESMYWLKILRDVNQDFQVDFKELIQEANELRKIFSAILRKQ